MQDTASQNEQSVNFCYISQIKSEYLVGRRCDPSIQICGTLSFLGIMFQQGKMQEHSWIQTLSRSGKKQWKKRKL